jgi:hypothetical protein
MSFFTLFSFACVLPGHFWICRTWSDPVATLQYATPVPGMWFSLQKAELLVIYSHVMPKSMETTKSGLVIDSVML